MGEVLIGKKRAAHQGSEHAAPGPPAISGILPPTTPSGQPYTPAPFLYIAKASKAHDGTCTHKTKKRKKRFLIKDSCMDVEHPANDPSKPLENTPPNGSDLVSKVACGVAKVQNTGQSTVKIGSYEVAVTGSDVILNLPTDNNSVHQSQSKLLDGIGLIAAWNDPYYNPATIKATGDPVAVATGDVIETIVDFTMRGTIDVDFARHYASSRCREKSAFGRGGFRHSLQSFIVTKGDKVTLHEPDGSRIEIAKLTPRSEAWHRGRSVKFSRAVDGFEVFALSNRRTREFAPLVQGGPAVLRRIRDRYGNAIELVYEGDRLVTVIDTAKRELRLLYGKHGFIVRAELWARGALQCFLDYAYDDRGQLVSSTDALGRSESFVYDAARRLIEKKLRIGPRFFFTYDDLGRCVKSTAAGRLQNVELHFQQTPGEVIVTGNPEPREYKMSKRGDMLVEATLDGASVKELAYDEDQLVVSVKNAAGDEQKREYDARGLVTKIIENDGLERIFEHDERGLPVKRIEGERVWKLIWDRRGSLQEIIDDTGRSTHYEIDRFGRLVRCSFGNQVIATYAYDDEHNLIGVSDPRGATTRWEHDALGMPLAEIDALQRRATWTYDVVGRPTRQTLRDGTTLDFTWDANDNVVKSSDGSGAPIAFEYGSNGTLARVTHKDGQTFELAYDVLDRLREVQNPKGERHELAYDRAGRMIEERTFDGQTIRYQYSRRELLSRITFEDDLFIEHEHDDYGRISARRSPHGDTVFERDAAGRVIKASVIEHDITIDVEMERDEKGRVIATKQHGLEIRYTYDENGNVIERTLPNGQVTKYHWDPLRALIGLEHDGQKVLLQRDVLGREVRRYFYASGVDARFAYDNDDRLVDQVVVAPARIANHPPAIITQRKWSYGPHARVRELKDLRWGTTSYLHDPRGMLIDAERGAHHERYEYDGASDIVADHRGAHAIRMGNVCVGAPGVRFEVDARRRRKKKIDANGDETTYLWDCFDRLREAKLPSGERVLFRYDAFGRRVQKIIVPRETGEPGPRSKPRVVAYLWDGNELAMEIDSELGARVFVSDPTSMKPLLHGERGETFAVFSDHLGVPKELVDASGKVAWSAAHTAFGAIVEVRRDDVHEGAREVSSPFRLLGQYADDETGLAYTRFRYFDPATARWLSQDPLRLHGGFNYYAFDGSPVVVSDKFGLFTAAKFKDFLESYADKRRTAMAIVDANPTGYSQRTVAASSDGQIGYNGEPRDPSDPRYPQDKTVHAEEQVQSPGGREAIGADKPHCANCTNSLIDNNDVGATSISPKWEPRPADVKGDPSGW